MKLDQKDWGCPKKTRARLDTVIGMYREYIGRSVPPDRQYWTVGGQCAGPNGVVRRGSEYDHVVREGLIQPAQFHSVEIESDIHAVNSRLAGPTWYHGDFYRMMVCASNARQFNPSIVNCDLLRMPKYGIPDVARIVSLITAHDLHDVLLVCNLITRIRSHHCPLEEMVSMLDRDPLISACGGWDRLTPYGYNGTGRNGRTEMGTVMMRRI